MLLDFTIVFFSIFYNIYYAFSEGEKSRKARRIQGLVTALYLFAVLDITLLGRQPSVRRAELELFWSYKFIWKYPWGLMCRNVIGNVILFIPLGLILQNYFSKQISVTLTGIFGFCFSLGIEMIQLILKIGLFEFDDLFHNTLGAVIGAGLFYVVLCWKNPSENKIEKTIKILLPAIIFTIVIFVSNSREFWKI